MNKHKKVTRLTIVAIIFLISIACSLINPLTAENNPTATPLPYPTNWKLLLADNFSDNNNVWGSLVAEDEVGSISSKVENGLLDVTLLSKEQGARNSVFQSKIADLKDFFISFEAEQKDLENDAYYGLEFRTINQQGYVFMIDQKKSQYSLAFIDTKWNPIIDVTTSTAINSEKPNKIGLLINGSKITMFINDQEIATISDSRWESSGTFGFTLGLYDPNEKVNVSFDNLQIFGPSSTSMLLTPTPITPIANSTAPVAMSTVIPSTATRELTSMTPGPAVLQDNLIYFRSQSLPLATAFPKNPNDTFLVILLAIPSNSRLYPEDLDWTVLDETNHELQSIGFSIPQNFESDPQKADIFTFFGRLLDGSVVIASNSDQTVIALIFVVSKGLSRVTLVNPQKQDYSISILATPLSLDSGLMPTMTCNSCIVEQPNGSENWTFTP
jgi:hypothetical protein